MAAREAALKELKVLQGLLPICCECKKSEMIVAVGSSSRSTCSEHSEASFTHSLCKECARALYGDLLDDTSGAEG